MWGVLHDQYTCKLIVIVYSKNSNYNTDDFYNDDDDPNDNDDPNDDNYW